MKPITLKVRNELVWPIYPLIVGVILFSCYILHVEATLADRLRETTQQRDEYRVRLDAQNDFFKSHILAQEVK